MGHPQNNVPPDGARGFCSGADLPEREAVVFMNPSTSTSAGSIEKPRAWQLEADRQQLEELRQVLLEQTDQLARLQAAGAPQQSQDYVQKLITTYERALRQAQEQALFHQQVLDE
jgi:hypothetical protein